MQPVISLQRTNTGNPDFQTLVTHLDYELWVELKEDRATYDQHNKVLDIKTAVLLYEGNAPVACGCFKPFDDVTVEIKRMYVEKAWRGRGFSKQVLKALEGWAVEKNYTAAVLETSIHFATAIALYKGAGYAVIPNYPPYVGLPESVCLKKTL